METKTLNIRIAFLIIIPLIFQCCSRDPNGPYGNMDDNITMIKGQVLNLNSEPLEGVYVSTFWAAVSTDQSGNFFIKDLPYTDDRMTINFHKEGYFDAVQGFTPIGNCTNYLKIALAEKKLLGTIDNNSGGELTGNGVSFRFDKNTFTGTDGNAINGKINIYAKAVNPDNSNFGISMPGGDFQAVSNQNRNGILYSYGYVKIEASAANGKPVLPMKNFLGRVKIPLTMLAEAPDTLPTWVLDYRGIWKETGVAIRTGNEYSFYSDKTGNINCDLFSRNALVKGKLCDNNKPVVNELVKIGQITTFTNSNGLYSSLVPTGIRNKISTRLGNYDLFPLSPGGAAVVNFGECNECDKSSSGEKYLYAETPDGILSDQNIVSRKEGNNLIIIAKSEYKSMEATLTLTIENFKGLGIYTLIGEIILKNSECAWGYRAENGNINFFSSLDGVTCGKFSIDLGYYRYLSTCGENSNLGKNIKLSNGKIMLKIN